VPHPLDEIAPAIARWLAPYVAEELRGTARPGPPQLSVEFDEVTCEEYLKELGDRVLERAQVFFEALAEKAAQGQSGLDSLELVERLDRFEGEMARPPVDSPRMIASLLTNSLKRRAKTLGLPRPWTEGATSDNRTLWSDRDGIARRMVEGILSEDIRRFGHPADALGGPRPLKDRERLAREES